jgi:Ca-activated chloride channel family protein
MGNITFVHPWVLILLPFIPILIYGRFYRKLGQYDPRIPISSKSLLSFEKSNSLKIFVLKTLPVFYGVGLVTILIALARPQEIETKISKNVEGIDIMIVLDISDSMLIEDMKPINRMEAAKQTLIDFVKGRESDRIGVVIFAGEAFTLVPLTLDYDLIQQRVSEITTAREARVKDGTALGVALANAAGRLKDSTAKSRVVIFLTDGENNSGTIDPETGLAIAKGFGVKIYSIAIGKSGPTRIPIYSKDMFGNKIKSYQPFVSTVNEELLNRMASETGGKSYSAENERSLSEIFKDINALEKTKVDINTYTKSNELFPPFLKWGFWLMILGLSLDIFFIRRWPA